MTPVRSRHRAAVTHPEQVGELLNAIEGFSGIVRSALQLAPLVFVRPGELRKAEWSDVDLAVAEWRIPAERMKMREAHIVPLSKKALAILQELKPLIENVTQRVRLYAFYPWLVRAFDQSFKAKSPRPFVVSEVLHGKTRVATQIGSTPSTSWTA